jgi:hypothetical protein
MLSIDSNAWSLRSFDGFTLQITQRATGKTRSVNRAALPSASELASMSGARFDRLCREAFESREG